MFLKEVSWWLISSRYLCSPWATNPNDTLLETKVSSCPFSVASCRGCLCVAFLQSSCFHLPPLNACTFFASMIFYVRLSCLSSRFFSTRQQRYQRWCPVKQHPSTVAWPLLRDAVKVYQSVGRCKSSLFPVWTCLDQNGSSLCTCATACIAKQDKVIQFYSVFWNEYYIIQWTCCQ